MSRRIAAAAPAERGYALIAAVAAIAVFATLALVVIMATRMSIATGSSELARARADAAADAGLAIAAHGLVAGEDVFLELVRGRAHQIEFQGSRITIRVADERGKIPINHLEDDTIIRMFRQAGLSDAQLAIASDSLADWIDGDDQPHANGAEAAWYAPLGIAPRNGGLLSIDELARVRGVGPALVARLRPYVTVDAGVKAIDPTYARPQALAAMNEGGDIAPDAIERQQDAANGGTALDTSTRKNFLNRPMTISVDADTPDGGHAHHEAVIVVTGDANKPYLLHAVR